MKLAVKFIAKRYNITDVGDTILDFIMTYYASQVPLWKESMLEADFNQDGKLSFLEFQDAVFGWHLLLLKVLGLSRSF